MPLRPDLHEANRLSWNAATRAHNAHKRDQAAFLAGGGSTLFPEEIELLGPLAGKRVVHLQCNAGQDTLGLVQLGAADVVGVDISDEAIGFARALSAESGLAARFERADVFDWLAAHAGAGLDVAFASYGALGWLSDLGAWARGVAGVLAPGGRLVVVEFHPFLAMLDASGAVTQPYFHDEPVGWPEGIGDYVGDSGPALWPGAYEPGERFANPHPVWEFAWTLGDIVSAVAAAGLVVEVLREYPYSNGCRFFPSMRPAPGRRWLLAGASAPLMFALGCRR